MGSMGPLTRARHWCPLGCPRPVGEAPVVATTTGCPISEPWNTLPHTEEARGLAAGCRRLARM